MVNIRFFHSFAIFVKVCFFTSTIVAAASLLASCMSSRYCQPAFLVMMMMVLMMMMMVMVMMVMVTWSPGIIVKAPSPKAMTSVMEVTVTEIPPCRIV